MTSISLATWPRALLSSSGYYPQASGLGIGDSTLVIRYSQPMNIVGLGIDLVEINRVRHLLVRYGERFRDRIFTDHEWEYAHRFVDPSVRLAARFAGKEAVMKSLYVGWRVLRWKDIEITGGGPPLVRLVGSAALRAEALKVEQVLISITHTTERAMVLALSVGNASAASPGASSN